MKLYLYMCKVSALQNLLDAFFTLVDRRVYLRKKIRRIPQDKERQI